ncbi:protein UPSTREAM OF FLC-like [Chenopodium quinoa]|uniref:protein UPSTREAM OF FLC-like n=1 Tax=Chenopodium quinoa TaxID=63459 RepID=UPI000B78AA2D|nr:protein UPSTREAM OF FLC-like [Chenopodium quinoa]XP_021724394.1 protein UPSTREAM OF FLC-like [Chenopodium quinoa]
MEGRMKKYRQVSPERAKVWKERSPKYVQNRKVPVVYYLCRNRQLEHPHFIEVPISSPEGLYLRDVIERLNNLRGRGMASMYSWSSKRSYKSGFVWHDLCEDDLILPAHGDEYILKGSEIIEDSNSDRFSPVAVYRMHNLKQLPEPPTCRSHEDTSPSMSTDDKSTDDKETKHPHEDETSPPSQRSGSSAVSPDSRAGSHSPWGASLSLTEYKLPKSEGAADASTQTEENPRQVNQKETCTRGVSTDDGTLGGEQHEDTQNHADSSKQNPEISGNSVSPPTSSSASSSGGKAETLESLIRSDLSKINSFRRLEVEDMQMPSSSKMKASNMLMQLISCGSISVKDHSFGLIPLYRPRFSDSKFPSPLYSTSVMLGELDCLSDNSRLMGLRLEDKEYFSGSLVETKMPKEQGDGRTLKRSSSYNADRSSKKFDSVDNNGEATSTKTKCIPRSIKTSLSKPRSESLRSPISDKPRVSSDGSRESRVISHDMANGGSKRMSEPSSGKNPSTRVNSFREEEIQEKIIKIEERLASGARIIIQSKEN